MRTKGPGIAPWSFYKNDPLDNLIDMQSTESYRTFQYSNSKEKAKNSKKNYEQINREKIDTIKEEKKEKSQQKITNTINGYCPIVSTSLELLEVRDRVISLNQKYLLVVAMREALKGQFREKESKVMRQKFQCLFPILKPKESYSQMHQIKKSKSSFQSSSHLFADSYLNSGSQFL